MSCLRQTFHHTFRLFAWLTLFALLISAGCLGPVKGAIALRDAQDLFNEASMEAYAQYKNTVQGQGVEALPPPSPDEKYQKVVEIIEGEVLGNVTRDDLKVNAYAIAAFAYWRLEKYVKAKNTAEAGLDLYKRSGLVTNRRDYGMLLILGGLVKHSEAYGEYQAKRARVAFLSPADAEHFAQSMKEAIDKVDMVNLEIDKNEPIAVYANQQQLRIIKNILDVWESVQRREDRKKAICDWCNKADTIWQTKFPAEDYPAKTHVDDLSQAIRELRSVYGCA